MQVGIHKSHPPLFTVSLSLSLFLLRNESTSPTRKIRTEKFDDDAKKSIQFLPLATEIYNSTLTPQTYWVTFEYDLE
jgi:hypothetical protein